MFLALNEIKRSPLRYGLIVSLIVLIAYLVFFLSALANGLANLNRSGVDAWQADSILLSKDSFQTLSLSSIEPDLVKEVKADEVAGLSTLSTVVWTQESPRDEEKTKATIFAVEKKSFLLPQVREGETLKGSNQVLISKRLAQENGYKVGDRLKLAKTDKELEIVGVTDEASYNVAPLLYVEMETYEELLADVNPQLIGTLNAIVARGHVEPHPKEDVELLSLSDFIQKIPGYGAQVLTFGFMIGFLVLIAAIVIGIFMYVLTMQKIPIFGVMKTQGIATSYIGKSVVIQTLFLVGTGLLIGFGLTLLSALVLPSQVPFLLNGSFSLGIAVALVVCSVLGSLFSVRVVAKIDPLKSIS